MPRLSSQLKGSEKTFDVVLNGGSPWGFTLDGGSEFRKKLCVSKITHGGKADLSQSIAVGDEIVAINGIDCISRAEAMELVRCSRQKLKIRLQREGVAGPLIQSNGPAVKKSMDIVPNLYKTAAEHFSNSDFYSTYNIDRKKYAEMTQNQNIYASTDNLSSSLDDLLESCRQGSQKQQNMANSTIMGQANERLSSSFTEIANGRTSPSPEGDGLSGISLPEGTWPVLHQRTNTSPGRIQKVTVKSTNISVSPQKGSPPGRDTENQQATSASVPQDDWFGRWLLDKPQRVTPINAGAVHYRDKTKDQDKEIPDRRISFHEKSEGRKSQSLPRSKSFAGPTSYGVTVTATAVKRNEGSSTLPPSTSPNRYTSSGLIQERAARPTSSSGAGLNEASSRPVERQWNSLVSVTPGDTVEVRLPREKTTPKMTASESTSSLDSLGTTDSSAGGARRQCPDPPPRRSVSKLLSSFRSQGRRFVPEEIPAKFGAVSRISAGDSSQPIHSASRSWPTENVVESKPARSEVIRQSWHAESAVTTCQSRREANSSISSTSSDVTPEKKLSKSSSVRVKSSVVIRNMRSSSSSSVDENAGPTVYRSVQVSPNGENNRSGQLPPRKKLSDGNPPGKSFGDTGQWMPQNKRNAEAEPSRIEDTQILQRLLKDKVNNSEPVPSVKSRIATFEGGMRHEASGGPLYQDAGRRFQNRSFSQGKIEVQRPLKSYSSVDSLLETRRPLKFNETSTSKEGKSPEKYPSRLIETMEKRGATLPDTRSSKRFSETLTEKRGSPTETRSPTNLRTAAAGNEDLQPESRLSVKIYTTKQESPSEGDKIPTKQLETIDNLNRRRSDDNFRGLSSSPETGEHKSDIRQDRQQGLEKPSRKLEISASFENKVNSEMKRAAPPNNRSPLSNFRESDFKPKPVEPELAPTSSNDENEVFWDADDSLPPPPPLQVLDPLETSQDSLPLPSPPREVIVEFPTSYEGYNSRGMSAERERALVEKGIVKPEEMAVVESAPVDDGKQSAVELNGPGKFDTSGVSEQPLETTSSTDLSSPGNSSLENKRDSHRAPPPAPLIITSTPTKDELGEMDASLDNSASPYSVCSTSSTPSGSRPNSMLSPKLEALDKEKSVLVESMKQKIVDLRSQMDEIKDEIDSNEELGEKVTKIVEGKASAVEFSKYQLFTGELNKIIGLLLILTQRMHRYEMLLNDLDMSEEADRQQRDILLSKIDKVTLQHEEACKIKEVNDKRGEAVSKMLENCLEEEEFADFQYYIDMKTQLALMHAEIRDKVKMGEERLNTLTSTKIDWSIFSLA